MRVGVKFLRFGKLDGDQVVFLYEDGSVKIPAWRCRNDHGEWICEITARR
jgi:hypothetical protein